MARQKVTPGSKADELIFNVLDHKDAAALAVLGDHLAPSLVELIRRACLGDCDAEEIARVLEREGMMAAAVAAHFLRAKFLPDDASKVPVYLNIITIEKKLGLERAVAAHQRVLRRLTGVGNQEETVPELHRDGLSVQCAFNDSARHRAAIDALPSLPLCGDPLRDPYFMKSLWHRPGDGVSEDYSFFVRDEAGRPIVLVECDTQCDAHLGCREVGLELTTVCGGPRLAEARRLALEQLELIVNWAGCARMYLETPASAPLAEEEDQLLLSVGQRLSFSTRNAWIELGRGMDEIVAGYRATTRQRVRWGRENMEVRDSTDPSLDVLAAYRDAYLRLGRAASLDEDFLRDALSRGDIQACVGYHQGELASILLTSRHRGTTYDMATLRVGAPKPPLTHILVHRAIELARLQGQERFDFGPIYEGGQFGGKMKSIAEFKAGFASSFETRAFVVVRF